MNMKKYTTANYLTTIEVKEAEEKLITLLDLGTEVTSKFGYQPQFKVQLAGSDEVKLFTPNGKSVNEMIEQEGEESTKWVGKQFKVGIEINKNNNEMVVILPKS